jgi:hypothetical protein
MDLSLLTTYFLTIYSFLHNFETVHGNGKVWLTVSSVVDKVREEGVTRIEQRKIELNWDNLPTSGDSHWIGLFNRELQDTVTTSEALVHINPNTISRGRYKTDIEFPVVEFTPGNLTTDCLGFWIYHMEGQRVLTGNCIRAYPFWMRDNLGDIEDKALRELMLPGTHNAGSYEVGYKSGTGARLKKYTLCQDESVFNQLVYGIRYLDLRVAHEAVKGRTEMLWIVHGILKVGITLEEILQQVAAFLDATDSEIVVLDFHRFEMGFDPKVNGIETVKERHQLVYQLLEKYLSQHMAFNGNGYYVRVRDLLNAKTRLVVGYAGFRYLRREPKLYPRVRHLWAEADNITHLEFYFSTKLCHQISYEATSAMAQLTPTTWGVVFDKYGGLRKMAQDVNYLITNWFSDRWWRCANIVSSDFFLGNNLIQVTIESNKKRAFEQRLKSTFSGHYANNPTL